MAQPPRLTRVRNEEQANDDEIPVHPLFAAAPAQKALSEAIGTIDIRRVSRGKSRHVAWLPADQLPDEAALEEQYGAGDYELIGRTADRSRILRRCFVSVGDEPDELEPEAPAAPAAPAVPGGLLPALVPLIGLVIKELQESRKEGLTLMMGFLERSQQQNDGVLKAMSGLMSARLEDNRVIIDALSKGQKGGGVSADQAADLMALGASMAGDGDGDGDEKTARLVEAFTNGLAAMHMATSGGSSAST